MRRLGIVLAHGPESDEAQVALELSRAAGAAGAAAYVFAMDAGVRAAGALVEVAAEVVVCGTSCERLGVTVPEGAVVGSQYDHAALVRGCERVVALT